MAERSSFQWQLVVAVPVIIIAGSLAWGLYTPRQPTVATGSYDAVPVVDASSPSPDDAAAESPLVVTETKVGTGATANVGDRVSVHYVGTLVDGTQFDSSRENGRPFDFDLGKGQVIKGWDQGVVGMKVGGLRHLVIPPSLAYGKRGYPPVIPPRSTLIFDVELLDVKPKL